jgi:intracellular septation protein
MKNLLHSAKFLALDMASTLFFLGVYLLTKNIPLAVGLGMVLGIGQIAWEFARKRPIDTMQWLSLFLVLAAGTATFLTDDPRFVMIKPTLIYAIVGIVMLKPGWMNRYLPTIAIEVVPDIAVIFGFIWSALMFASAALNMVLALRLDPATWAAFMSAYGIISKLALFAIQYATMRLIGRRRRARLAAAAEAPEAATV